MGGEECLGSDVVMQVLDDGPSQAQSVESAGAPSDLVQYDQAVLGCVIENIRRFSHFHHECGLSLHQVIPGSDSGENAIQNVDSGLGGWHKTSNMSHQTNQCDLSNIGAFPRHVRSGDEGDLM